MNKMLKNIIICVAVALLSVIIANVYALFRHGVRSAYMDFMFIVPLAAAIPFVLMYALRSQLHESEHYAIFANLYA
ncbi:MAG: hypothetical protein FWG45_05430, partial [Oscillospiraceae bacterium]|nr:hypothetical protein [Oscillospiraceae bacterium]